MARRHQLGKWGEELAADRLKADGWAILARNWRDGPRELDLVAYRDGVLAFVEVKSRSGERCGLPLEGITWRKRRELERAATAWLLQWGGRLPSLRAVRFDAISVWWSSGRPDRGSPDRGSVELFHLEDAWWRGE